MCAKKSNNNIAKFELVTDGLVLLQREYPENVRYINATERKTKALELQLFADGGAASTGDAAPAADNAAEGGADPEATDSAAEGSGSENGEGEAGEEAKKPSPAERRKAFGQMMSGEYKGSCRRDDAERGADRGAEPRSQPGDAGGCWKPSQRSTAPTPPTLRP